MEVEVNLDSKKGGLIPGRTVDISEFGISAVFPTELPVGESVRLQIRFPRELVSVTAVIRNRNIFRYGFEFDHPDIGRDLIKKLPI
jgi:hypothetical protein